MTGMTEFERNIERFERAQAELRDLVRDAHAAAKDLRAAVSEAQAAANEARDAARAAVAEDIAARVDEGLAEYQQTVKDAMDRAVKRVFDQFDELARLFIHGRRSGGEGLDEMIAELRERDERRRSANRRWS